MLNAEPHIILGISKQANLKEIKSQYHKLAKKFHPDKYLGDPKYAGQQFNKISKAYETMISPEYQRVKHLSYQQGVFHPKRSNHQGFQCDPRFQPPIQRGPRVLCNGTVLMNGLHPSQMSYEYLQNLRKNVR